MENMNVESEIRSDLHFDDLVGGSEGGPLLERSDAPAVRYANLAEVPDDVAGIEEWNATDGIPRLFDWDFRV